MAGPKGECPLAPEGRRSLRKCCQNRRRTLRGHALRDLGPATHARGSPTTPILGVPPREAVGVSLLTVGATSLVGFAQRSRRGMVEFPTGLLFAVAGAGVLFGFLGMLPLLDQP